MSRISHCLWFDGKAEEAARFYTSVFKDGKLGRISYYGNEGNDVHHQPAGRVMTAEFEINGQRYLALNGGPDFKFSEAFSIVVTCEDQAEVDYYWKRLTEGGQEVQCGWLKDKFGLSWQVVPKQLTELMAGGGARADRVMKAFMGMKKFDVAALQRAAEGKS